MKTLYLVRHAKSSWDFPELSDDQRPLNKRGKRNAPDMGKRLRKQGILPDLMLSSPAVRAYTTCTIIAKELGYPHSEIQTNGTIYHASPRTLLAAVNKVDNSIDRLMMFGHNPGFTEFANKLARTDIWNIPTCGVFACTFDLEDWSSVTFGLGKMLFYDYPKRKTDTSGQ